MLFPRLDRWIQKIPVIRKYYTKYYGTIRHSFFRINKKLHLVNTPLYVHWLATYDCNFHCKHCEANAGEKTVNVEHVRTVLPYALAHRLDWKDEATFQKQGDERQDPLPIHLAKQAVGEIHRRYSEQSHRIKGALGVASRILAGETKKPIDGDHPVYVEIKRDIEDHAQ